jgi:hypothetical protein
MVCYRVNFTFTFTSVDWNRILTIKALYEMLTVAHIFLQISWFVSLCACIFLPSGTKKRMVLLSPGYKDLLE